MELARPLLDLLCPRTCAGCGAPVGNETLHICWNCLAALPLIHPPFCSICGDPVEGAITQEYSCSTCTDRRPAFERARSAARYRGTLMTILQDFKYGQATHLGRDLGTLLEACIRTYAGGFHADAITFVPLYHRKERERTFNQSRLLARELGLRLDLPVLHRSLFRTRYTATQTHLTAAERAANVRGAFEVREAERSWLAGRSVFLVDDVMTTGATLRECSQVLKEAGAYRVFVVTVARG